MNATDVELVVAQLERRGLVAGDGARLLDDVAAFLRRFVVFQRPAQVDAVALWTAHSHAIDAADTTLYLSITSPEKRSGKSRLFEVLRLLVREPWNASNVSEAAVYRKIDRASPTLLLDEVDAIFAKGSEKEGLRGLFNDGYRRGGTATRCVPPKYEDRDFEVFSAKAFAGIGRLPDTVEDRSAVIRLERRRRAEPVERFRRREAEPEGFRLRDELAAWCSEHLETLRDAHPDIPGELNDRAADGFEPLFAIADIAGADWSARARAAACELTGAERDEQSDATLLLAHVREAFNEKGTDRISTADLLGCLIDRDDAPWARWWARDVEAGKTRGPASRLARVLRPFGIESHKVRIVEKSLRGYLRDDFGAAWERYLEAPVPLSSDKRTATRNSAGQAPYSPESTERPKRPKTPSEQGCSLVPSFLPEPEEQERSEAPMTEPEIAEAFDAAIVAEDVPEGAGACEACGQISVALETLPLIGKVCEDCSARWKPELAYWERWNRHVREQDAS